MTHIQQVCDDILFDFDFSTHLFRVLLFRWIKRTLSHRDRHIYEHPGHTDHLAKLIYPLQTIPQHPWGIQLTPMVELTLKILACMFSRPQNLVTSSDPSTFMSSITTNSHIYSHNVYSLSKGHSVQPRWEMNTPSSVYIEDADAQPSPPAQQSQCIDSTMLDISTRQ